MPLDRDRYREASDRSNDLVTRYSRDAKGRGGGRSKTTSRESVPPRDYRGCPECGDESGRAGLLCPSCVEAWTWAVEHQDPELRERLTEVVAAFDLVAGQPSPFLDPSVLLAMGRRGETVILCARRREANWVRRRYVPALAQLLEASDVRIGMPSEVQDFLTNDHDDHEEDQDADAR